LFIGSFGESILEFLKLDEKVTGEYICEASNNVNEFLNIDSFDSLNISEWHNSTATKVFHVTRVNGE